jgi:hypothetical protein
MCHDMFKVKQLKENLGLLFEIPQAHSHHYFFNVMSLIIIFFTEYPEKTTDLSQVTDKLYYIM